MRFLHLADVHLDTPFSGRSPELRKRLRQAGRDAFGRAVQLALAEDVHAVLVAGDLFDGARLSFETEGFLLDQLRRLDAAGIAVVYAAGNHDPGRDGARTAGLPWPPGVTLVPDATPRRIAIRSADGRVRGYVTAAGHAGPSEGRDLAASFPRPPGDLPEVGLLHTQVVGARDETEHHAYAPTSLETLERAGYRYWALGHVHTRQVLCDDPAIHYPGNIQGRTHAESGPRGGLLVELGDGPARVEFRALGPIRWHTLRVGGLASATALDGIVRAVRRRWDEVRAAAGEADADGWMLRVILTGGTPLWRELQSRENRSTLARELAEVLEAHDVELVASQVHAPVDVDEHRGRQDVLGVALRRIAGLREGTEALPEGLADELAGQDPDDAKAVAAYVRELLDDGEGSVLARMLDLDRGR